MEDKESNELTSGNYSIEVKDFGPIVRANVDLRPLTVFIGPSNTGKSYLAILIYALHQFFGEDNVPFYWRRPRYGRKRFARSAINSLQRNASELKSLTNWLSAVPEDETVPSLPKDVLALLRPVLERPEVENQLEAEIRRCFGVGDRSDLVRRAGSPSTTKINLIIPQTIGSQAIRYAFEFGPSSADFSGKIPSVESIEMGQKISEEFHLEAQDLMMWEDPTSSDDPDPDLGPVLQLLVHVLFQSLIRPLTQNAFYLPAGRTGVMHSHQVVVSTLIQNATTAGLRPSADVPMLSGVLADFLNGLVVMSERRLRKSSVKLAETLEARILKGVVGLNRANTGYPVFTYRPDGWKNDLPLTRTSSMVSELAPVVLYLRHFVRPGNLLIIEEPESHLHPAMQAAFAHELARLVRSGVRVILTTHSDWFLEQLGNLVRLGMLPWERRKGIPNANCALRPEDVGAWLFEPKQRPKGSVIREVILDPETGLFPTDFDAVIESLYNESAEIFNRMQEGAGE